MYIINKIISNLGVNVLQMYVLQYSFVADVTIVDET